MTLVEVEVRREIATTFGIIAAGQKRYAAPSGDGRWLVYQWLPQGGRRGRAVLARPEWIRRGRYRLETAEQRLAVHAEYQHARDYLGMSNDEAVRWLASAYDKSLKTLREWGFDTTHAEAAEQWERRSKKRVS